MPKKIFTIQPYDDGDKEITIYGPDMEIQVGWDDCDLDQVEKDTKKMVSLLNKHWNNK